VGGACSANGEKRNVYRLMVRKPEGVRISLMLYRSFKETTRQFL
jgi:hypothetical protein